MSFSNLIDMAVSANSDTVTTARAEQAGYMKLTSDSCSSADTPQRCRELTLVRRITVFVQMLKME